MPDWKKVTEQVKEKLPRLDEAKDMVVKLAKDIKKSGEEIYTEYKTNREQEQRQKGAEASAGSTTSNTTPSSDNS